MSQQQQPHCFRSLSFSLRNHLNHHSLTLAIVVVVALVTLITFSSHPCVHSLSSPSSTPPSTQPIPQITNSLNTPSSNQDRYSQNAMAICRLRGTRHLPSLHGTLYFSLPPSSSRDNSPIMTDSYKECIIGFNTLEFSKRSLPFHIHEFGNVLENDGMSVGGHLLDQQQDIGATISPLSIQDSLKVNNILNFQHYSHASSLLSLENVIGRSMIVHHFENNGTRRIGQCVIAVMPSLTRMSSTSSSSSSSSSNSSINSSAGSSNSINSVGENLSNSIKSIITSSIDFSKMKYKLVAHLRGTNRMSQPVNGTVIITEEDESKKMTIYLKMCHLMNSISGWNQLDRRRTFGHVYS
ncbi:hypothetical protein C9374_006180 [Naegleria lovaniensis]|uniref:Superoxide dismutase copper/zinc binding domain-containing protein n=1 Tax=Naegleria lovaniensis TaxID=51637 RepID=A0AA88GIU6_NAELO|nr:uncharacterized protein C9374_006180 [Naegleria lovaniensis]KAG2381796.1 hypothetical protein C9374_006180 [Naegleria lovaniensis]